MATMTDVGEIFHAMHEAVPEADVRVVGGIGTIALLDADKILPDDHEVVVPEGFQFASYRRNGTRRDVDMLLLNTDAEMLEAVYRAAVLASASRLDISVSRSIKSDEIRTYNPVGKHIIRDDGSHYHHLGLYRARVPESGVAEWTVRPPSRDIAYFAMLAPRFHTLSYDVRRLRGIHRKDLVGGKLDDMNEIVHGVEEFFTNEEDEAYADLDGLAVIVRDLGRMNLFQAIRQYGWPMAKAQVNKRYLMAHSTWNGYQRGENSRYDDHLDRLLADPELPAQLTRRNL